jgi:hypothetical protein
MPAFSMDETRFWRPAGLGGAELTGPSRSSLYPEAHAHDSARPGCRLRAVGRYFLDETAWDVWR